MDWFWLLWIGLVLGLVSCAACQWHGYREGYRKGRRERDLATHAEGYMEGFEKGFQAAEVTVKVSRDPVIRTVPSPPASEFKPEPRRGYISGIGYSELREDD